MRALIVGSGGRAHALAWALARSPDLDELHAAPGNPGIAAVGTCHPVRAEDAEGLQELDGLVTRMLEESGYDLDDPVVLEGEEREVVTEYVAAHEIAQAVERETEDISPGDVGAAINGFRAVFDHLVSTRSSADASITPSGEVEE